MEKRPNQPRQARVNVVACSALNDLEHQTIPKTASIRLHLDNVEWRICNVAAKQLGIPRTGISPANRLIEDLNCESLDTVELFVEIEEQFEITISDDA